MTLSEIKLLFAYNAWATNRIFDALAQMPEEQYLGDMKSSHGGIHGTLVHIVAAQKMWLSRWVGQPDTKFVTTAEVPTLADLKALWETTGRATAQFIGTLTDRKLQDTFTMKTTAGNTFTHIYWQAMQHLVNHTSYHRGQVVTMMRQLGVKPPNTDMIAFYRETAKLG